jgi:hypothetical protein
MRPILNRLSAEPAALGTVAASVLPAMAALHVITLDAEEIGVLVVAVNGIVGFALRVLVTPAPPRRKRAATA